MNGGPREGRAGALGLFLVLASLAGCGYSTRSMLPEGVRSVQVEVFGNETFYREIEFKLTRELIADLQDRSAWRVARGGADATLSGRILAVERPTLLENRRGIVSEQALIVTAEVVLTAAEGRELERFTTANRAEFVVERGETVESAFDESLRDLARVIVNTLQRGSFLHDLEVAPMPAN